MRTLRECVTTIALLALVMSGGGPVITAQQETRQPSIEQAIAPDGVAQINALLAEKRALTPTQQKIDSRLLHTKRMLTRETTVTTSEVNLARRADGMVEVELRAEVTDGLLSSLRRMGVDVVSALPEGRSILVAADLLQIESIAALPGILFVQPKPAFTTLGNPLGGGSSASARRDVRARRDRLALERPSLIRSLKGAVAEQVTNTGSINSEGDTTHRAVNARVTYGIDGSGIKVGVLSDGVSSLAASQGSGDLGAVTVISGQAGSGDEGTAMLEIVHDLAPGAQLFFATALPTPAQFAQNIRALRAAGCDIIVDDVLYYAETPFQDGQAPSVISITNGGVVIQAVKDVTAAGALYVSSAGNSGNVDWGTSGTWEGDFVDGGSVPTPIASIDPFGRVHSFGANAYDLVQFSYLPQPYQPNHTGPVTLHWSDPLGASNNDYDIFILNNSGTRVYDFSMNVQSGFQDPYEQMGVAYALERIVIVKESGSPRFLHLDTNGGRLSVATGGSTRGHADTSSPSSMSVAATPAASPFVTDPLPQPLPAGPYPNPFTSSSRVEFFSSDGPRQIFYTPAGAALTSGNVSSTGGQILAKPDVTAADGVTVTGAGGFPVPFFGTSAAAPHAAAIAALAMAYNPCANAAQIRSALLAGTVDIQRAGPDSVAGAGIVMATAAVAATATAPTIVANPTNQTVDMNSAATLSVTATALTGLSYQWYRGSRSAPTLIPGATSSTYVTGALIAPDSYWVRVFGCHGSVDSTAATVSIRYIDSTGSFTDPTLTTGLTVIRAVHITQLRERIDALRTAAGLAAYPWTDPLLPAQATAIKPVHVSELRSAITDVYNARSLTAPTFTGSIASGTTIRAVHISELRNAVVAVE